VGGDCGEGAGRRRGGMGEMGIEYVVADWKMYGSEGSGGSPKTTSQLCSAALKEDIIGSGQECNGNRDMIVNQWQLMYHTKQASVKWARSGSRCAENTYRTGINENCCSTTTTRLDPISLIILALKQPSACSLTRTPTKKRTS
jgi:hypothetical protein